MRGSHVAKCFANISTVNAYHISFSYLSILPCPHSPNPTPIQSIVLCSGVAMEACEFWSALSDDNDAHGVLQSHLATLIPSLISRLQLKEEQILQVKKKRNTVERT